MQYKDSIKAASGTASRPYPVWSGAEVTDATEATDDIEATNATDAIDATEATNATDATEATDDIKGRIGAAQDGFRNSLEEFASLFSFCSFFLKAV